MNSSGMTGLQLSGGRG